MTFQAVTCEIVMMTHLTFIGHHYSAIIVHNMLFDTHTV